MARPTKPDVLCVRCAQPVVVAPWGGRVRHNCPHGMVCAIEGPYCVECQWDRAEEEAAKVKEAP